MRDFDIILLVGGVMLLMRDGIDWGGGWVWPIPDVAGVPAAVSQEFRRPSHLGVDLMYRQGGAWFVRAGTPVLAARDGKVWSVDHTARGWSVVLDHGAPFATFYQHLAEDPGLSKGQAVSAGDAIGVVGSDPTDPARVRHLHFAVWYKGNGDAASVDPAQAMKSWRRMVWTA